MLILVVGSWNAARTFKCDKCLEFIFVRLPHHNTEYFHHSPTCKLIRPTPILTSSTPINTNANHIHYTNPQIRINETSLFIEYRPSILILLTRAPTALCSVRYDDNKDAQHSWRQIQHYPSYCTCLRCIGTTRRNLTLTNLVMMLLLI